MRIERSTSGGPAVTLDSAKAQARIDFADDDLELMRMIGAATRELEERASLAVLRQTIRLRLEGWPESGLIRLPIGPVLDGASFTVTADGAAVEAVDLLPGLRPDLMLTHLVTDTLAEAEVVVEYEAGWGTVASDVPDDIAHAILDQVSSYYDLRGGGMARRDVPLSPHMARIAARYRGVRL